MRTFSVRPASRIVGFIWCLALAIAPATHAQTHAECEQRFAPRSGQPGKDVMWVATIDQLVIAMLKAAKVTSRDRVIDLGSGDGKIPIAAGKQFGASALGIEYNPDLVELARCHASAAGVADRVEFKQGDIFATDFSAASVLTLYLSPSINLKLRPTILSMRPGTRVVSNAFDMKDWQADQLIESEIGNTRAFLWIVPAQVNGDWTFTSASDGSTFQVKLQQKFQRLESTAGIQPQLAVQGGNVNGAEIEFTVAGLERQPIRMRGRVEHEQIRVTATRAGGTTRYLGSRRAL